MITFAYAASALGAVVAVPAARGMEVARDTEGAAGGVAAVTRMAG